MGELFCDYVTGMFTVEQWEDSLAEQSFAEFGLMAQAGYHEAGHAVLQYALGAGPTLVQLKTTIKEDAAGDRSIAYGGVSFTAKKWHERANRYAVAGEYHPVVVSLGIILAAGAAAERKYCLEAGAPVRVAFGSQNDCLNIDFIAERLEARGRNPDAYRRLIWRRAQLALEEPEIWSAVNELAGWLNDCYWPTDDDVGVHEDSMPGRKARAIIKKAGVCRGMQLPARLG
jgi:hypothetical protein